MRNAGVGNGEREEWMEGGMEGGGMEGGRNGGRNRRRDRGRNEWKERGEDEITYYIVACTVEI